jgi:hypothetical protein
VLILRRINVSHRGSSSSVMALAYTHRETITCRKLGPPAVVRRICGYVGLYAWCLQRGRVRVRVRGGGGGGRERETTLRQNHSTSTAHQLIDTRSKTS